MPSGRPPTARREAWHRQVATPSHSDVHVGCVAQAFGLHSAIKSGQELQPRRLRYNHRALLASRKWN